MDPSVVLARLASGNAEDLNFASMVISAAFRENYNGYSNAQRTILLDGVEQIARGEAKTNGLAVRRAATTAFSILSIIALDTTKVREDSEISRRVLRVFRDSKNLESRTLAVHLLGNLLPRSSEKSEIEGVLFSVASLPASSDRVHPQTALDALLKAGETGIPVLRRLHEEGAVKEPGARVYLRELAKKGYRPVQK